MLFFYVAPLLVAVLIGVVLATVAWSRRQVPGAAPFVMLMIGVSLWSAFYAVELVSPDVPTKLVYEKLGYIGSGMIPTAWMMFALAYTGRTWWRTSRGLVAFAVQPVLTLALVLTNPWHSLVITDVALHPGGLPLVLDLGYGPWYWVNIAYAYGLMLVGTWLIYRTIAGRPHLHRRQVVALLTAVLVPVLGNAFYEADLTASIDPTPFTFMLTGVVFFWGFLRLHLLDITPLARDVVFQELTDGVVVVDALGRVVDMNRTAESILGPATQLLGRTAVDIFALTMPEVVATLAGPPIQAELTLGPQAEGQYFHLRASPLQRPGSDVAGLILVFSDITARKLAEHALTHQAMHDGLTDLPNRRLLHTRLRQAVDRATSDRPRFALLLLDLDRFKEINDTLGHHAGDGLLKEVAGRLHAASDTFTTVARLGGDEFAIVLPDASAETAQHFARVIRARLEEDFELEGQAVAISASIGIAVYPDDGTDPDALLRCADVAMYAAKTDPAGYAVYASELDRTGSKRWMLAAELRPTQRKTA